MRGQLMPPTGVKPRPTGMGIIKLKNNGDFFIANEGRRPIYIDGRPVLSGNKWKLNNNSVVEIAGLRFVFLINQELIALIKAEAAKISLHTPAPPLATVTTLPTITKRVKKSKQPLQITKDLGRWKPTDDLLLINAVLQTTDLTAVHLGVKFSCRFTLREVQERWYALLYDPVISKLAWQAMRQLHPEAIAAIQSKALFSRPEEALLSKIGSTSQPKLDVFQELLNKHPGVFYPSRTARSLQVHWQLLKQYYLLEDQAVQPLPRGDQVLNFSDAEQLVDDTKLKDTRDEVLEHELMIADRHQKREIRQLEQELPRWQVLVDSITGMSSPDFDNQTLAALRGRMVRYLMRSREITLGRATKDRQIDVDLSLEGPAWKISRKQDVQGASGLHLTIGGAAVHSRSEDEEPAGGKGIKRTAAQVFSGGVPKRRSSSRNGGNKHNFWNRSPTLVGRF
ncbi:Microspherule protein 1 [Acipenser ruthenus]|uniref:Microspherule protein 1 n=1 Tax=Acipenser ruthenus TaxID=7906 RepID=A0A444V0K7_ACIRT|nr:Microspherule protein 1 [Acipenser ruthenus]